MSVSTESICKDKCTLKGRVVLFRLSYRCLDYQTYTDKLPAQHPPTLQLTSANTQAHLTIFFAIFLSWVTIAFFSTLQRQNTEISKQIFPEKEYRGLNPNFHIHASVSDLYIPTIGLPILLEEICRPILGLYKSLTDTWMLKLGLRSRYSQKRNT